MQRQTAVDALIDAAQDVAAAVGASSDRSGARGVADAPGSLVVATLSVLAVAEAPIVTVALVGYVITAARHPERPGLRVDDWRAVCAAGVRGTALLVGAALPIAAALAGSGVLEAEAGSVAPGSEPAPILAAGIGALAVATWHAAAVGGAAVVASDWDLTRGVRFGRSHAGIRLSAALAGLTGGVGVVGFGLTAIPVVGPVLAAGVGAVGVAVAARLVGRAVVETSGTEGSGVTMDGVGSGRGRADHPGRRFGGDSTRCRGEREARPAATPRRSRRGRL